MTNCRPSGRQWRGFEMISTQKELRAAFWRDNPDAARRMIPAYSGSGRMYCTDTRVAWCDYVDHLQRAGAISESLADRATLQPGRVITARGE